MNSDEKSRSLFHLSISQLRELILQKKHDNLILSEILRELHGRKSRAAKDLRLELERLGVKANPISRVGDQKAHLKNVDVGEISSYTPTAHDIRPSKASASTKFKLTDEQIHSIDLFATGRNLKINAFAGTGKTSTLEEMSHGTSKKGLYLAFNRAIAESASRRFPSRVDCRTIHSVAFSVVRRQIASEFKLTGAMNTNIVAQELNLQPFMCRDFQIDVQTIAGLVLDTISTFFYSDDFDIRIDHMPIRGILHFITAEERKALSETIRNFASRLWDRMIQPNDPLPLGHDGYVKYWSLCRPMIEADFILLDEAQDSNPVILGVLRQQQCQVVLVGDRHQQIYEWRGAVNAMEHFATNCESFLTSSFRFGPSIAHLANFVLARLEEPRRIIGAGVNNQRSSKGPYRAIISRTNSSLINALIQNIQTGERPYLEGGKDDLKRLLVGVQQLQRGQPSQVPEFFGFRSWKELVDCSNTEQGRDFRTIVKLVNVHGLTSLFKAVSGAEVSLQDATVVLSTTHKAKGGEWDSVVLADDFKIPSRNLAGDELFTAREELRINYVAFTRARLELTLPDNLRSWLSL